MAVGILENYCRVKGEEQDYCHQLCPVTRSDHDFCGSRHISFPYDDLDSFGSFSSVIHLDSFSGSRYGLTLDSH